MMKAD